MASGPSTGRSAPSAPPPNRLLAQLRDELAFQRTRLTSVQDSLVTEETDDLVLEIRAQIRDLTSRIQEAKRDLLADNARRPGQSSPPQHINSTSALAWEESGQESTSSNSLGQSYHLARPGTFKWTSSRSSRNTGEMSRYSDVPAQSNRSLSQKRTFDSTHLGTGASVGESKSRRTTPSPRPDTFSSSPASGMPEIIDLTGDDDDIVQLQAQEEARLRRNKAYADQGYRTAQLLATGQQTDDLSGFDLPIAPIPSSQQPASLSMETRFHVPGAFPDPNQVASPLAVRPNQEYSDSFAGSSRGTAYPAPECSVYGNGASEYPFATTFDMINGNQYDASRPGYLANGSALATDFTTASQLPNYINSTGSGNLMDVINQTISYDFDTMTDRYGNPLNSRLRGFIDDVVNDPRKSAEEIQNLLSNIRPDQDIPIEERGNTPEAMKYPLYVYQLVALKWMTDMETGSNKGGILADDMGLGKTISTLSLMVSRQASRTDPVKTNLIIGPVALIRQWEAEIRSKLKSEHGLSVYLHHGSQKKPTYADLKIFDVVLTTYGSLGAEWKRYEQHTADMDRNHPSYRAEEDPILAKRCPLLHPKSRWYRIILDEAQCIKNPGTQSSKGAALLASTYRWCLTGTPMMNGVKELFPLIRFLRIGPYNKQAAFTEAFKSLTPTPGKSYATRNREMAMQKLRTVLKAIMLRRMKSSLMDGKPILHLPPKTEISEHVAFSEDELNFYKALEGKTQVQFNKYLRAGTVGKNYSNILVLLLRLRQACCHPHLDMDIEYVGGDTNPDEMIDFAKELKPVVVEQIKARAAESFDCPICLDAVINPTIPIPCGHTVCSGCFVKVIEESIHHGIRNGQDEGSSGSAVCPSCRGPISSKKITDFDTFKKVHMSESDEEEEEEQEEEQGEDSSEDAEEEDVDSDSEFDIFKSGNFKTSKKPNGQPKSKKGKEKAEDVVKPHQLKALRKDANKNKDSRRKYMQYLEEHWEDSAKVSKVMELLHDIQETEEKTIIFSQWTALLDLIEIPMRRDLTAGYVRYDGGMSPTQRNDAVQAFVQNPDVKVMLCSLRAGNAGLNLTQASRVIICDPFWNPYIEMQAVDRAHRIGQQREVKVHRILVLETIEDRIMNLQEAKRTLVEAALDEGESKSIGRLDSRELAYLFGVGPR